MNWHRVQTYDEYIDFDRELLRLNDKLSTSLDMRLTFNTEQHNAYIVLSKTDDYGNSVELGKEIHITWEEGLRQLGEQVDLLIGE